MDRLCSNAFQYGIVLIRDDTRCFALINQPNRMVHVCRQVNALHCKSTREMAKFV